MSIVWQCTLSRGRCIRVSQPTIHTAFVLRSVEQPLKKGKNRIIQAGQQGCGGCEGGGSDTSAAVARHRAEPRVQAGRQAGRQGEDCSCSQAVRQSKQGCEPSQKQPACSLRGPAARHTRPAECSAVHGRGGSQEVEARPQTAAPNKQTASQQVSFQQKKNGNVGDSLFHTHSIYSKLR